MSVATNIQQQATDLFANNNPALVIRGIDEVTWSALCNTVYPGADPDSVVMAIDYCRARKLDIMLKPVHLVPMQVTDARSKQKVWRDVPIPGIGMYRIQADRSGNYAGADEPEFGPDVTEEFPDPWNQGQFVTVTYPAWCKYTVYKIVSGHRVAFSSKELWKENYATQSSKTTAPNAMWKKRSYGQLAKCAEAQALRKAWPEIGSEPTAEEMEGKQPLSEEREINPAPQRQQKQNSTAALKAAIDGKPEPQAAAEPEQSASAFGLDDWKLHIREAGDVHAWQQAYAEAWSWAQNQDATTQQEIKAVAGEAKRRIDDQLQPTA